MSLKNIEFIFGVGGNEKKTHQVQFLKDWVYEKKKEFGVSSTIFS